MLIEVLGPGCERCDTLHERVQAAVANLGLNAEVARVHSMAAMAARGVASIPALAVEGDLKVQGAVLTVGQIERILSAVR